jgi:dephospho-CoA kinase
MILVGFTGTHGAGKGTITNYLIREHGFVYFSVSEFLAAEVERRGLTADRNARAEVANEYRSKGPTALMEAVYATVDPTLSRVVLEPQYTPDEVYFIQSKGGLVIAIDASLETRYARIQNRGSLKDTISFEEFKAFQEREMGSVNSNQQNLSQAMVSADIHLVNNGTVEELEQALESELKKRNLI